MKSNAKNMSRLYHGSLVGRRHVWNNQGVSNAEKPLRGRQVIKQTELPDGFVVLLQKRVCCTRLIPVTRSAPSSLCSTSCRYTLWSVTGPGRGDEDAKGGGMSGSLLEATEMLHESVRGVKERRRLNTERRLKGFWFSYSFKE